MVRIMSVRPEISISLNTVVHVGLMVPQVHWQIVSTSDVKVDGHQLTSQYRTFLTAEMLDHVTGVETWGFTSMLTKKEFRTKHVTITKQSTKHVIYTTNAEPVQPSENARKFLNTINSRFQSMVSSTGGRQ